MKIFALDPGNVESGYAVITMPEFSLLEFGKEENATLLQRIGRLKDAVDVSVIEMVACYGMPVGKDVFETCVWIGRFAQMLDGCDLDYVYRKDEKIHLCGSMKAKDANIRQALINRYARHDFKNGKGTKKNPDVFYGVAKDAWSAIAVGVTYFDMGKEKKDGRNNKNRTDKERVREFGLLD